MTTATNPVTGDLIKTKGSNDAYRSGWERIFGKKEQKENLDKSKTKEEDKNDSAK